jgi:hypothetical protein
MSNTRKCPYCAELISIEAIKCKHCGEMLHKKPAEQVIEHRISTPLPQTHSLGVVSFVLAIVGLFTSFIFPFAIQIIGIIMGHIAKNDINANPGKFSGSGLVTAGLIINYLVIVFSLLAVLILGIGMAALLSGTN